jgi:nicotinic acid mononucleotide adenylyltransferase
MPFPDGHALLIGVDNYAELPRWDALTTLHDGVSHLALQQTSGMRFLAALDFRQL